MKYKSKNYYSNASAFIEEVVIPGLDKGSLRQSQIKPDININELLIKYCDLFTLVTKGGEQNTVTDYYQQLVYQLDLDEPLEFNKEAEDKINNVIKLFIEYSKKQALTNIGIIVTLQERIANVIRHLYHHTGLEHSLSSLFDSITYLKQRNLTFTENTAQKRDLSSGIDPSKILEIIDSSSKALKHSKDNLNALNRVLNIDSNIGKYAYQLCYEMLYDLLEDNTLKVKSNPEAPSLFTSRLHSYWSILKLLANTNKDVDVQSIARNLLVKAGRIIDINRDGLNPKNPTSNSYQYSLSDLDRLVTNNTRLLVESHELSLYTHNLTWRERWNKLREIRREASNLNSIDQQRYLSEEINQLVQEIIKESEELLGTPPCDYAVLSFGSLSRKEFFPGSDLECLVVLDKERKEDTLADKLYNRSIEQYFTTLFKLVDAQIRCLGEHKEGFGLDESNPATEYDTFVITLDSLEKTYLKERKNTKVDGYHYSLVRPALLYNSNSYNNIFEKYEKIMSQILSFIHKEQAIDQLSAHISKFLKMSKDKLSFIALESNEINLPNKSINLKECYYSPLVHLAIDLGLFYNIKSNNTLEIYEELHRKRVLSDKVFNTLKEAYTYIAELRIEAHNFKKAQYDDVYLPNSNKSGHLILEEEAFEKLKRINLEVITPLYKAIEIIVKDKLNSSRNKVSKGQKDIPTGVEYVANHYYKVHGKEALDNPHILAELISIYSRHYIRRYSLEKAQQSEAKYLRDGLDSITVPVPSKVPENAVILEEAGRRGKLMLRLEVAEKLLKEDGSFKEKEKEEYGRRKVIGIEHNGYKLHFKENPELPGMEYALGSFIREITGRGAPVTKLLKFTVGNKIYPVQVSRTVSGINYQTALNENAECLTKISSRSFGLMCIASLLINPEDGKPDNYILEPVREPENKDNYNIVCVDNDHGLVPALAKEKVHTKVMVKTILYCMKQMHEKLDQETRERILALNHAVLLGKWLENLNRVDNEYRNLFTDEEQARLLNQGETRGIRSVISKYEKEGASPVITPILIRQGVIAKLYQKFQQLKYILEHNEKITPMQLLYIIEPLLAKYYDDPRLKNLEVKKVFNDLFKDQYSTVMAGRYGTMINSRQLLQSVLQEVPNLEDIVKKKHTPAEAIDELKIIKLQSTTLNKVRQELIADNDKPFKELLLDSFRERVINGNSGEGKGVDFTTLDEKKQQFILETMRGSSFTELSLSGSSVLTDALLEGVLKSSPGLSVLNVSGCINLSSSALRSIARYCPLIEKLIISNIPKLSYIGTATGIGSLTFNNLRRLDLSNNIALNDIRIKAPRLEWLDLSNCEQITDEALSALMNKCLSINVLKLEGCRNVSNAELKIMHPLLAAMRTELLSGGQISKDKIIFNNLKISRKEIKIISCMLMSSTTLALLDLPRNNIGDEGVKLIGEALKTNTTLISLGLNGGNLDNEGGVAISEALKTNTTLTSLDLGYNSIGVEGGKLIAEALKINTTLTSLYILNIGAGELLTIRSYLARNKLLHDPTLTSLHLSNNNLGDEGGIAISEVLKTNTTLTSLDLSSNNLGDEGGIALAEALRINTTLTSLYISSNKISGQVLRAIKSYLARNKLLLNDPTLTSLDLAWNNLGDEGGIVIGEALKTNTTLTFLNLSDNNLGDEGGKAIAEALRINTTLTFLDLTWNNIDAELLGIIEGSYFRNVINQEAIKHRLQISTKNQVELHKEQIESSYLSTIAPKVETKAKGINTPSKLRTNAEKRRAMFLDSANIASMQESITQNIVKATSEEAELTGVEHQRTGQLDIPESAKNTSSPRNYARKEYNKREGIVGVNRATLPDRTRTFLKSEGSSEPVRKSLNVERRSTLLEYNASKSASILNKPELCEAAKLNKIIKVTTLLRDGANPNYTDEKQGRSALHYATELGHKRIIELLLSNTIPVQVNLQDNNGQTALHLAAMAGHKEAVEMLLSAGADRGIRDKSGKPPKDYASSFKVKMLLEIKAEKIIIGI